MPPVINSQDFKTVFEHTPGLCLLLDHQLRIVAASEDFVSATEVDRKSLLGKHISEVFLEKSDLEKTILRAFQNKVPTVISAQKYPLLTGKCFWQATNVPVFDEKGDVIFIIHKVAEIQTPTESLSRFDDDLERRVHERTRLYEELVNTIDGIVWEANLGKSPYTFVSKHAERILGYPIERWTKEPGFWQHILHPEDRAKIYTVYHDKSGRQKEWRNEYRVVAADGRHVWLKDFATLISENGVPKKLRGLMVDITEQKKAEAEVVKAAKVKSEFLANMSHEIRTPLNAVIGMASLVTETSLTKEQKEYVTTIKKSADTLLSLINDILDFSKIEAGKLSLEVVDFDIETLLKNACDLVSFNASKKGLKIETNVEAKVPVSLRGDVGRLLQVLVNLLSNAVKFTEKGKISLRIVNKGELKNGKKNIKFEVHDTGVGFSQAHHEQLFKPFQQGDSSTARRYGGSGLGLSICKGLVDIMGGEIGAKSEQGKGSFFWFCVPLHEGERQMKTPNPMYVKTRGRFKTSKRILLAEDNAANQKVITRFLEKRGFYADTVGNGIEVLDAFSRKRYDIVLMDCQMPEMDGYQATAEIRKIESTEGKNRTPILALTAHALAGDREKCLAAGMDDYLTKPLDFHILENILRKWMSGKSEKMRSRGQESKIKSPKKKKMQALSRERIAALESLQIKGEPDIVQELADIYFVATAEKIQKLEGLLKTEDLEGFCKIAHSLKSTCSSIGAEIMTKICQQIEDLKLKSPSLETRERLVAELKEEFLRASSELVSILESRQLKTA